MTTAADAPVRRNANRPRLHETHPAIAAQAVDAATPNLTPGSNKRVRWRCDAGHEWTATVYDRTGKGSGCPYCCGYYAVPGVSDLATLHPEVAAQLVDPVHAALRPNSKRIVLWRCDHGHEWTASILNRVRRGSGCPQCSGRSPIPGETDLATLRPDIAREVIDLDPATLTVGSARRVLFRCARGHRWATTVASRTSMNSGCPYCAGDLPIPGETDLLTLRPDIAAEAVDLDPRTVTAGSGRKVLWRCHECRHEWGAQVRDRTRARPSGCPACATSGYRASLPGYLYLLARQQGPSAQRKIGITNEPTSRLARLRRLGWLPLEVSEAMDGAHVRNTERAFLRLLDQQGVPRARWGERGEHGSTETWNYALMPIDSLADVLHALAGVERAASA